MPDPKIVDFQEYKARLLEEASEPEWTVEEVSDLFDSISDEELDEIMMQIIEAFNVDDRLLLTPANDDGDVTFSVYFVSEEDDEDWFNDEDGDDFGGP